MSSKSTLFRPVCQPVPGQFHGLFSAPFPGCLSDRSDFKSQKSVTLTLLPQRSAIPVDRSENKRTDLFHVMAPGKVVFRVSIGLYK